MRPPCNSLEHSLSLPLTFTSKLLPKSLVLASVSTVIKVLTTVQSLRRLCCCMYQDRMAACKLLAGLPMHSHMLMA